MVVVGEQRRSIPVEDGGNQLVSVAIDGDADDIHGSDGPTANINTC